MFAFSAAYKGELSKLLHRKKYIVFLIIGLGICLAWAGIGSLISNLIGRHGGLFITLVPDPIGVLPFFLQILLPLLIFMGATDLVTAEGANHTIKAMLYRPVVRWKLYLAKLAAVLSYTAVYLVCVFVVSSVLNQLLGRAMNLEEFLAALASYALTLAPLAVLAAFAGFVALLGRSGSMTMLLLVILYLVMHVLPIVFPIFAEILFTSYLNWHRFWLGVMPGLPRILHMLAIVVGSGVVFFMAGSLVFDKKEY